MKNKFKTIVESLDTTFNDLITKEPVQITELPEGMPKKGIYLFSEGENDFYAGRTKRLKVRLREHSRPGSNHNTAPLAFRLAREKTGFTQATYTQEGSREQLEEMPEFKEAFNEAKVRVSEMDIHFIEESDSLRQVLLQIYVAVCLGTSHNDFDTH